MKTTNLIAWWRKFDARRRAIGLAPARLATAHWFWSRAYAPEEAAEQDRLWLQGLPGLLPATP